MNDLRELMGKSLSEEAIAELMLARSALEQKNEAIDARDAVIRDLLGKIRALECELKEARMVAPATGNALKHEGTEDVIEDIVYLLVKYETGPSGFGSGEGGCAGIDPEKTSIPCGKILALLRDRWGVEVIDGEPAVIDPYIHRVIEVVKGPGVDNRVVPLSKGYRLGKKIIAPMKLRVIEGGEAQNGEMSRSGRGT